jgi:hypothetical protein
MKVDKLPVWTVPLLMSCKTRELSTPFTRWERNQSRLWRTGKSLITILAIHTLSTIKKRFRMMASH